MSFESSHDKTSNKTCVTSKDSDQPVHPPSIARVFIHPSLDSSEAVEGICNQWWMIRLRGCTSLNVGFVLRLLIYEQQRPKTIVHCKHGNGIFGDPDVTLYIKT